MFTPSKHRFGIMAMQIDALIPEQARLLPPEQALAGILSFSHAGLVRDLASHGFKTIEIGGDLAMLLPHTFSPQAIQELVQVKHELGLSYTVHLPLWSLEPSTIQTPVRQGSVQVLVDCIRITAPLEAESYVLHATGALAAEFYHMHIPELARMILMRQFQNGARESIRAILDQTGISPRKLAIETVEFPFDLTLELADGFDTSICFDTGHILVGFSGPVDLFDALERSLPRLGEIHLHDGPWQGPEMRLGYGKDHSPLGTGDLDVVRFLERLELENFNGPIIFELRVPEALVSLEYLDKLVHKLPRT